MFTSLEKLVVIEKVVKKIPNRYEAVRVMSCEARRLNALVVRGAEPVEGFKATTAAMQRLFDDKIQYDFVERTADPDELFSE
jgi:DNA-directed RNA polymerase subunit K/omega